MEVSSGRSRAGTRFGKYELIRLLGRGGMGEVYEARDIQKGRTVAVKILPQHYAQDPSFRSRFTREAHAAAALQEPHVVPIHDWGEIDGNLFIDMRLIRGSDLREIASPGPLNPSRAVAIISQIASALDAAHAEGLIHRDVKPENIVVTHDDFAYLLDFGIAEKAGDPHLTQAGMTVGSWAYMAPERLSGSQASKAVDIYSLACVLYETLTGARPFAINSMQQVINAHLYTPPPHASTANPRLPNALDAVIERGMAKEPDDRYGSAGALARAAQRALSAPTTDPNATLAAAHVNSPTAQQPRSEPWVPSHAPSCDTPAGQPRTGLSKPVIIGIAVSAAVILAAGGIAVGTVASRTTDDDRASTLPSSSLTRLPTSERIPLPSGRRPTASNDGDTPRPRATPPAAITGVDGLGQRCDAGFEVSGNPGAGSRAVRGTAETSCRFVDNVLNAYWRAGGPSASPRTISAAGGVPCNPRTTRCSGSFYILDCSPFDEHSWVTCRGGVNAVVHIY